MCWFISLSDMMLIDEEVETDDIKDKHKKCKDSQNRSDGWVTEIPNLATNKSRATFSF